MAPELREKARADERSDLFSLGATIYEMCQGYPPFAGALTEIQAASDTTPLPRLDRDDLPEDLQDLVFSLLASQPERRPASAAEVLTRLESIRARKSTPPPGTDDSQPFPRPDPAELQAPAAVRA
jgi:eukaryotic-like serine/threonine-protein kinase